MILRSLLVHVLRTKKKYYRELIGGCSFIINGLVRFQWPTVRFWVTLLIGFQVQITSYQPENYMLF